MPKRTLVSVVTSPRVWLLFALGFSSGLPLYLTGSTLSAWMTTAGISLKTIGFFSAVSFAYTLKFLWAPLMDRYVPPFLGRRRGWLLITQVLLALALVGMAQMDPATNPALLAGVAVLVAFLSASQDIVADAYRTDLLPVEERSFGVATFTLGYRVGMVAAMSLAFILADNLGWHASYLVMAALMGVGVVATLLGPEPETTGMPRSMVEAVVLPFREFFQRGWPALLALAFILLFRVGDAVAFRMTTPFVLKMGFSLTQVGIIQKGAGMAGSIGGAIVGGLLVSRLGVKRSLALFGSAQAATNLLYVALFTRGLDPVFLGITVGVDNFAGGLGAAAITVFMTALCNKRFSATQYALLSSLSAVPMHLLGTVSGVLQESLGWPGFFTATALAMAPAVLLLVFMPKELGALGEEAEGAPSVTPVPAAGGAGVVAGARKNAG